MKKHKIEFTLALCRKCGGKMFAKPGGYPEPGPMHGKPFVECADCDHGAIVMQTETAEARLSAGPGPRQQDKKIILPK